MRRPIRRRGAFQQLRQRRQLLPPVDPAGRVVRRVDDHEARSRTDRGVDGLEVEVEARRSQRHLPRHGVGGEQHRLVAEPGWLGEDDLVAGVEQQPEGDRDGPEGAGREGDVGRLERKAQLPADRLGQEGLRRLLAGLVGEPVLVVGQGPFADGRDEPVERHLVRIAEGEVGDGGIAAPFAVARAEVEALDGVEGPFAAAALRETMAMAARPQAFSCRARHRPRDGQLLLGHVGRDVGEERRAEVTLPRVRQHAEDVRPPLRLGGDLERAGERAAGGDADEDALLRAASSLLQRIASGPGMARTRSTSFRSTASPVSLGMKSGVQPCIGCGLKLGCGAAGVPSGLRACSMPLPRSGASSGSQTTILVSGRSFSEHPRHALERPAGAVAGHPVVEPVAREVGEDLPRRRARVVVGVGLVLELARHEPAIRGGQRLHLPDHADGALRRRGDHHLGPQEPHQPAPLDAERLGHDEHQRIALGRADHGQADAGVAAGRLDDGLARLQRSRPSPPPRSRRWRGGPSPSRAG